MKNNNIGWKREKHINSLPEVFSSINIPKDAGFWKKLFAFAGPGLMIAVGYMDPGNWATDIAGGAQFGYTLLSVILISNIFAMILHKDPFGKENFFFTITVVLSANKDLSHF